MYYEIDSEQILKDVDMIVSKVAAREYTPEGVSLFDSIRLTSSEHLLKEGWLDEAMMTIVDRLSPNIDITGDMLVLNYPDLDPSTEETIAASIDNFVTYFIVSQWFEQVLPSRMELYVNKASASLSAAVRLLTSRKRPSR